ncbi:MAG: acetyl-CoA hydrolase/transferase C-terminal domain-containing protein [Betaproteobacteria bacterium]
MPSITSLSDLNFPEFVQENDIIAWPQGPGEPLALTRMLVSQRKEIKNVSLFFGLTHSETLTPELTDNFKLLALNGAGSSRHVTSVADMVPCYVSAIPSMFRSGLLRAEVVLIQVKPISKGLYTLGVIADYTQAMVDQARVVVALINTSLPITRQDALIHEHDIDLFVQGDESIIDMPDPKPSEMESQIAKHVVGLIPDRATIQLGVGTLPVAIAYALKDHRDLGFHSGVVTDALVDLVERGVVTNAFKGCDQGRTITGGLFGTQQLRDFAHRSGLIEMRSSDYTHNLSVAATISKYHTINSAIEIDLTGQINSEVAGGRYLGAVGGQVDFVRAGLASAGGHSIIAFESTSLKGQQSRIVPSLGNRPVSTGRFEVDLIVTEFGVANLRGCPLKERAKRLIAIAHPVHRESLIKAVFEGGTFS